MFLRYVGWLDKKSAGKIAAGKPTSLPDYHARAANLDEQQNRVFLQEVRQFLAELEALDLRARQIIAEARGRHPGGRLLPGEPVPAVPPELRELQSRKEQLTEATVQRLKQQLGEEAFGRVQQYAQARIGSQLKVTAAPHPPAGR